jgi:TolA-binding protein
MSSARSIAVANDVSRMMRRNGATVRALTGSAIDVSRQEHENACREIGQLSMRLARLESEIRRLNTRVARVATLEHIPKRQTIGARRVSDVHAGRE